MCAQQEDRLALIRFSCLLFSSISYSDLGLRCFVGLQLPIIEQASPCPAIKSNNFTESDKDDSYVQADSFLNSIRAGISGDIPPSAESEPTTSQVRLLNIHLKTKFEQ